MTTIASNQRLFSKPSVLEAKPSQNVMNVRRRLRRAIRHVERLSGLIERIDRAPTMDHIIDITSALADVEREDILGPSRKRELADTRKAIIGVAYSWGYGWSQIGRALGGRTHSTIIKAHQSFNDLVISEPKLRDLYCRVSRQLLKS